MILPAKIEKKTTEFDEKYIEVSDKLSEEQALHNQDLATLDEITIQRDELKKELARALGTDGNLRPEDYLIKAAAGHIGGSLSSEEVMELLENIKVEDKNDKSDDFKTLYDLLIGNASPEVINSYVEAAKTAMKSNDYEEAIAQYEKAYELDVSNSDILMSLAHAYRQNGNIEKANELYRKIVSDFPDTQNAQDALEYISDEE